MTDQPLFDDHLVHLAAERIQPGDRGGEMISQVAPGNDAAARREKVVVTPIGNHQDAASCGAAGPVLTTKSLRSPSTLKKRRASACARSTWCVDGIEMPCAWQICLVSSLLSTPWVEPTRVRLADHLAVSPIDPQDADFVQLLWPSPKATTG